MMPSRITYVSRLVCFGMLFFLSVICIPGTTCQAQDQVDFERQIKPILEKHCIRCHGPESQESNEDEPFRADDREQLLENYVDANDLEFSDLYIYITAKDDTVMPPVDDGGPLAESEIELIKNWILQGAEWPENVKVEVVKEVVEEVENQVAEEEKAKDATQDNLTLASEVTGLLHPLVLHFPIALLIGGAFFALFGFRGESPMADAAYYCLWLGALSAIFACLSGWFFAIDKNMTEWQRFDFNNSIDVHRWGGIVVAALAFMLALIAASSRRRDPYGTGGFWKLSMILLACLTGYVAHHGGKMTHDGLHEKLINKGTLLFENLSGEKKAPAKNVDDEDAEDTEGSGEASEENTDADNKDEEGGDDAGFDEDDKMQDNGQGNAAASVDG